MKQKVIVLNDTVYGARHISRLNDDDVTRLQFNLPVLQLRVTMDPAALVNHRVGQVIDLIGLVFFECVNLSGVNVRQKSTSGILYHLPDPCCGLENKMAKVTQALVL